MHELSGIVTSIDDDFPLDSGPTTTRKHTDSSCLDWSFTPQVDVQADGNARCFITQRPPSKPPQNAMHGSGIHLIRELQLQPSILERKERRAKEQQVFQGSLARKIPPVEIRVSEEEFRKLGGDLQALKKRALPAMQQDLEGDNRRHDVSHGGRWMHEIPEVGVRPLVKGKTVRPASLPRGEASRNLSDSKVSSHSSRLPQVPRLPFVSSAGKLDDPDCWRAVKTAGKKGVVSSEGRSKMSSWSLTKAMSSLRQ
jgi:hypothetical protein